MKVFVAYYRVSTIRQGNSRLGLEAQQRAVTAFLKPDDTVIYNYLEVESGKKNSRPELEKAIEAAKRNNATLIIAKLDRLSRNAAFIFALRDAGCDFVCADMPEANTITIGIFAVMAQHEREVISSRTKAALQVRKEQGKKLGTPRNLNNEARQKGQYVRQQNARTNRANKQATEMVKLYRDKGLSLREIAGKLNEAGYNTRRGNRFFASTVKNLLDRQ